MLVERLLFTSCLLPGMTRFQENETYVEITSELGETILFFCIDNNSKGHSNCKDCGLRKALWGKEEGQRICDLLVFYAKGDRRVLCFELFREFVHHSRNNRKGGIHFDEKKRYFLRGEDVPLNNSKRKN